MASFTTGSSNQGTRVTVNGMLKSPKRIPAAVVEMAGQDFIIDTLLRDAGGNDAGIVMYYESTPLYVSDAVLIVAEFGEIPATIGQMGQQRVVRTVKRALALKVSEEMRTRNDVDAVKLQMTQIRNTMRRSWEDAWLTAVLSNVTNTISATAVWSSASSKIRYDLAQAGYQVSNADADSNNGTGTQKFEWEADTLVISNKTYADFRSSDDVAKVFVGAAATQNPQLKGEVAPEFFGLRVVRSWRMPANTALVLKRKTIGGYSDERPLQASDMYEDKNTETWRTNVVRTSAMFLDQPKAACLITNV